ncbi:deoxyribodipyrimidine photo-lyase [Candidatus Dependentiae bacterium]|nr:deoxyribodipyrimidine photo-lyase [Candidatus Dependentiae bacterium]
MDKKHTRTLFIFRRDLRLEDNTGLQAALKESHTVIACFILDPRQVTEENAYKSTNALQFMFDSLLDLNTQLEDHKARLYLFYAVAEQLVKKLLESKVIDAVYINKDYTPFSKQRDQHLQDLCAQYGADFFSFDDLLLQAPEETLNKQKKPYSVFTPYFNANVIKLVKKPVQNTFNNYSTVLFPEEESFSLFKKILPQKQPLHVTPGRIGCLEILKHIDTFKNYSLKHNYPAIDTTGLSPHIKFGTCSIREIYYVIKKSMGITDLIRQLYWRDFYTIIGYYFPHVFGHAFHTSLDTISWDNNKELFKRWCEGTTGVPIVDAGMRQLNQTGFMHNRARLITASFLVKDLHIDWRWGELYFARLLTEYDPAVNNGNWQWVASTGSARQPYFRIFNPWLQQKNYDPDCTYIKQWIPELKNVSTKVIHAWYKQKQPTMHYPAPIVDHAQESIKSIQMYKKTSIKNKRLL